MTFTVTPKEANKINFMPETVVEEVLQNVAMILSTPQFSVPLDRKFGLSQRFVDKPVSIAKTIIISEILDAIESYEERAKIVDTSFKQDLMTGKLIPQVEVQIIG